MMRTKNIIDYIEYLWFGWLFLLLFNLFEGKYWFKNSSSKYYSHFTCFGCSSEIEHTLMLLHFLCSLYVNYQFSMLSGRQFFIQIVYMPY